MVWSLHAFYEKIDAAGALVNAAALTDPIITTSGDNLTVPSLNQIIALIAGVASGGDGYGRLASPSLLRRTRYYVAPVNGNADADAELDDPPAFLDLRENPLPLVTSEDAQFLVESDTTTTEAQWLLMCLSDGQIEQVPQGGIFTLRATNTSTLTADAWSNQALTLQENLPAGRYAIVGARIVGADMVAARFVFRGGSGWRPGAPAVVDDDSLDIPMFRNGGMGDWGQFEHNELPSVDFLAHSATSDHDVYLDLVQVREGPSA